MRTLSQPKLIDRRMHEDWQAAGGTDIYQRALEEARYILENHKPDPCLMMYLPQCVPSLSKLRQN